MVALLTQQSLTTMSESHESHRYLFGTEFMRTIHEMTANKWKRNDISGLSREFQTHVELIVK